MTHPSPRAIEAGAADLDTWLRNAGIFLAPDTINRISKSYLTALEAEGMVVVPKRITDKMIFAVIDATDKKHAPLSCTEFWDVALQAAQGGDDAGQ